MKSLDDLQVGSVVIATECEQEQSIPTQFEQMMGVSPSSKANRLMGVVVGYDLPFIMLHTKYGQELITTHTHKVNIVEDSLAKAVVGRVGGDEEVEKGVVRVSVGEYMGRWTS